MHNRRIAAFAAALLSIISCSEKAPRPSLVVGSKDSTPQIVIGEIIAQHLENRLRIPVDRDLGVGFSRVAHQSLVAGHIHLYPEDVGAAQSVIFHLPPMGDPGAAKSRVEAEYRDNRLEFLAPLGFSDKWTLAVTRDFSKANRMTKLSEAADYGPRWRMAAAKPEFLTREDGFAALQRVYSLGWSAAPKSVEGSAADYRLASEDGCNIVAGSESDPGLLSGEYQVLEDDRGAYSSYEQGIVVRAEKLVEYPELRKALEELSGRFDIGSVRRLAAAVDTGKRPVSVVASEFLQRK